METQCATNQEHYIEIYRSRVKHQLQNRTGYGVPLLPALLVLAVVMTLVIAALHRTYIMMYVPVYSYKTQTIVSKPGTPAPMFDNEVHVSLAHVRQEQLNHKLSLLQVMTSQASVQYRHNKQYTNTCDEYATLQTETHRYRVVSKVWHSINNYRNKDVTLVGDIAVDDLEWLVLMVRNWPGPMSVSVYINMEDDVQIYTMQHLSKYYDERILTKSNLDLHLVSESGTIYPSGYLRNVAVQNVVTSHVLLSTMRSVPSANMYQCLLHFIDYHTQNTMVLLLMEFAFTADPVPFAWNKHELLGQIQEGQLQPIYLSDDHSRKNEIFNQWKGANNYFMVQKWRETFAPIIMMQTKKVPLYNTSFGGHFDRYGIAAHSLHIQAQGLSFLVEPSHFMTHYTYNFQDTFKFSSCIVETFKHYRKYLRDHYGAVKFVDDNAENHF